MNQPQWGRCTPAAWFSRGEAKSRSTRSYEPALHGQSNLTENRNSHPRLALLWTNSISVFLASNSSVLIQIRSFTRSWFRTSTVSLLPDEKEREDDTPALGSQLNRSHSWRFFPPDMMQCWKLLEALFRSPGLHSVSPGGNGADFWKVGNPSSASGALIPVHLLWYRALAIWDDASDSWPKPKPALASLEGGWAGSMALHSYFSQSPKIGISLEPINMTVRSTMNR